MNVAAVGDDDEMTEGAKRQLVDNFSNHKKVHVKNGVLPFLPLLFYTSDYSPIDSF